MRRSRLVYRVCTVCTRTADVVDVALCGFNHERGTVESGVVPVTVFDWWGRRCLRSSGSTMTLDILTAPRFSQGSCRPNQRSCPL